MCIVYDKLLKPRRSFRITLYTTSAVLPCCLQNDLINTHSDNGKVSPATEFYKRQQTEKEEWKACRSAELYQSL